MTEPDSIARWQLAALHKSERTHGPSSGEQVVIQLFDELRSPLLRYLQGFGLPVQDGEEVTQEAFLALFQHSQQGKSRQNLRGWIFRVAHNLGLKRLHARNREAGAGECDLATRPDTTKNPEEQLLNRQRHKLLQAVLKALPERDQWCLSLRAEGLSYREIAEVLEMSPASVSVSLVRSLARFSRADS